MNHISIILISNLYNIYTATHAIIKLILKSAFLIKHKHEISFNINNRYSSQCTLRIKVFVFSHTDKSNKYNS